MNIQTINTEHSTYHILKTSHEGFITGVCLIEGGSFHAEYAQRALPGIMASMLGLGTENKSEEQINEMLESRGVELGISSTPEYLSVSFTCLSKDIETVIKLVIEQVTQPRFDKEAFDNLKSRALTKYRALKDDTAFQAAAMFSHLVYPPKHVSRSDMPEEIVKLLEDLNLKSLKDYHQEYSSILHPKWIVVGDVDAENIVNFCESVKPANVKHISMKREVLSALPIQPNMKKIVVKDKKSVDLRMGHAIDIDVHHPDYLPLCLAIDALGGSFSARLMRTVRDEDGLTYNVGSHLGGFAPHHHGHWCVYASFSPKLLDKGIMSIKKQLSIWMKGLTEEELSERKQGMIGKHTVMLSDAQVLAHKLAANVEKGYDIDYLYTFSEKVEAITLDQVNQVIKKYIFIDKLSCVYAGSV